MPCAQNSKAVVNAGFKFKFSSKKTLTIVGKPTIVFGGIRPDFVHATQTENFLNGKSLLNPGVIQGALDNLSWEVNPNATLIDASPTYRKRLAQSLFYKFVLSLSPESVNERYRSGGEILFRPLSSGKQTFDSDPTLWPVNKAMPKLEAFAQCSGEAEYINDIQGPPNELFGALVLAPAGPGTLGSIDTDEALKMEGVKAFFSAKSIPGVNSFVTVDIKSYVTEPEPLFADKVVIYAGQPVGIIVATSQSLANKAAQKVKVKVTNLKKPLLTVQDVLDSGDLTRIIVVPFKPLGGENKTTDEPIKPVEKKEAEGIPKHVIKGSFEIREQYHYSMETQTCLVIPTEEGLDVFPSSQFLSGIQMSISQCLLLPENCINVQNRRLGGAYGCKISRNGQVAVACALAAYILRKPVRMILKMETNMQAVGKRVPCLSKYDALVDDAGKVHLMNLDVYQDLGCSWNENQTLLTFLFLPSCYDSLTWIVKGFSVKTDKSSNTPARAPGAAEAIATLEHIFEHIATALNKDPLEVRSVNFSTKHRKQLTDMIKGLKESSDFENRKQQIQTFNEQNRWRKKGISLVPMTYKLHFVGNFHALVSIYRDGTVAITHGGIEMGQGINTKVAQVCAYKFGIDVSMVKVKSTNVLTAPNDNITAFSVTSETVCLAVIKCCDQLLNRLSPIKAKLGLNVAWKLIIKAAVFADVDLCATFMAKRDTFGELVFFYDIYGVTAIEVEVDLLTGNYIIPRCDIIEDAGVSLSPEVDVGQVEGAFVMGLGYWLTENIIFDPNTGAVLTDRSWNYKVPGPKDIPVDFRVTLLKNSSNPVGVLRSKATGEPPLCMSCGVLFALRDAINSALLDAGKQKQWLNIKIPFSPEHVFLAAFNGTTDYKLF